MFYVYIGKNIDYINSKKINNVTISYYHGHLYYQFTYIHNKPLTIDNKELISYNVHFNKRLAKTNELISNEILTYKTIIGKNNQPYEIAESYTELGKKLIHRREQLFERRKLYLDDYLNKMSKKVLTYLQLNKVNALLLSKNLSFTKTTGEIKIIKKTKQKFYQITFGKLRTLIENKSINYGIEVKT